jgi:hypothetical protein
MRAILKSSPKDRKRIEQHFLAGALRAAHGDGELLVEAYKAHKHDPDPYSLWARFEIAGRMNAQAHTNKDLSNVKFEMEV